MHLKPTHIKIASLLVAYGIVLFHSIVPHCNGGHAAFHISPSEHSTMHSENVDSCTSEHNEHNHCHLDHDDGLHVGYLKPHSNNSNDNSPFISIGYTLSLFKLVFFHQNQMAAYAEDIGIVRCCSHSSAKLFRGPPSANI